jgi:predicted Rossmann-fold nucleotide-binding protein
MGTEFWSGLVDWMRERLAGERMISPTDLVLMQAIDDPAEAVAIVRDAAERQGMAA